MDKYSNYYTDLGLLATNTKSIMPKESKDLLNAIDKAVVYKKRGAYLKSKGISTYYPYISIERPAEESINLTKAAFEMEVLRYDLNYDAQKQLYQKLLDLKNLPESNDLPLDKNSSGHFVVKLTPEQLENISFARCMLLPVKQGADSSTYGLDLGGAILTSADDLKVNWKKGIVTENFRAMEPVFDGHKIVTLPSVSSRGHTFYKVPIIYDEIFRRDLLVRYDTSTKKYEIIGFGSGIENGMLRFGGGDKPRLGHLITPIHIILSDDPSNEAMGVEIDESTGKPRMVTVIDKATGKPVIDEKTGQPKLVPKFVPSIISTSVDSNTGKPIYLKYTKGTPFVFTRDSAITNRPITRGNFFYFFAFTSPGNYGTTSQSGLINVDYGEVTRFTMEELQLLAKIMEEDGE
ncbi:MAG: hypothetical protein IKI08_03625 [Selenomonadaceae bacterium]|nr:hypothetical protein [Selenomonadaceae bacterium]